MFVEEPFFYKYAPILSLRPSEINALEELTDKDKDLILPIILLRGWVGSKKIDNSIPRIEDALGKRPFILDIDESFLDETKKVSGVYPRDVFGEVESLLSPANGYSNWVAYLENIPQAIPVLQLGDISQINSQIDRLTFLKRGMVVRFDIESMNNINDTKYVFKTLREKNVQDIFIIFDYGQVSPKDDLLLRNAAAVMHIQQAHAELPTALIAISCSSFPSSFHETYNGENPIYERMLFNQIRRYLPNDVRMIYSDRASARAEKLLGGGIPSPRIDYPLKEQWRFIKKTYSDPKDPNSEEKVALYTDAAKSIMQTEYWISGLHVWGTQMIELTSKGEGRGIDSPTKATAVRINLHMHQQIHYYDTDEALLDTEENWVD